MIALVAIVAVGYQTWRVASAIVDAERSAVVPLPTRENEIAFGDVKQTAEPTVTAAASTSTTAPPTPNPNAIGTGGLVAPTVAATHTPAPLPTSAATAAATATVGPTDEPDSPSRLDVLRKVVEAGMADGDPGTSQVWAGKTELYILVLGVDRRAAGGDQNADVIIIAHLDLMTKRMAAVSLPRDLLVDIPEIGPDKINGSFNYGVLARPDDPVAGVVKVRDTIESLFGVPIDNYVLLDFHGFEDVVDSVGGVDINVPDAIHDEEYPTEDYGIEVVDFDPGMQHMNGDRALKYVRTRHGDSDDGRRARQQQVLLALFEQGKGFSSIKRADKVIVALGDSVQTGFTLEQQLTLARLAYGMDETAITITSLGEPILSAGETPDGRWAYVGDIDEIVAFVQDALIIPATASETP